ncbi:MAG: Gfo/Idh/MocA family oxidoreductase [Proteobacteria bacterium]|nr:Gfo/Idh/MocA family oxidoreductase [Pseudomonadota bacterium]
MKKVKFAVVGAGWISQEAFLPSIPQLDNAEVTAIVTGDVAKAQKLADFYSIPHVFSYDQYGEMLSRKLVDAVYIALPNHLHAQYTIEAARAGVHALVEKPLSKTIAESEAMIAAAETHGVKLMTAYRLHSEPATIQFMDLISSGAIGVPRLFTSPFGFSIAPANHRLQAIAWGGPLQDLGVYCVNAARHVFMAEPTEVVAMSGRKPDDARFSEADECVSATLRFPGDAIAVFSSSFGMTPTDKLLVVGSTGQIEMENAYRFEFGRKITLTTESGVRVIDVPHVDNFSGQAAYFADCILKDVQPVPDGHEGLADMRVLVAIEEASRSGVKQLLPKSSRKVPPLVGTLREFPTTTRRLLL